MSQLLLAASPCSQCLTTKRRIVSGARAAEIVADCRATRNHFHCHKGTQRGLSVHCRGVHDLPDHQSLAHEMAVRLGIPVVEIDADSLGDGR